MSIAVQVALVMVVLLVLLLAAGVPIGVESDFLPPVSMICIAAIQCSVCNHPHREFSQVPTHSH